jgi:hypothetical protein
VNFSTYCELQLLTRELLSNLALVCYHANDIEQSLLHQEKATIICERVVGLDHYETAHAYVIIMLTSRRRQRRTELLGARPLLVLSRRW